MEKKKQSWLFLYFAVVFSEAKKKWERAKEKNVASLSSSISSISVDPIQRNSKAHNELFSNFFTDFPDKMIGIDYFQGLKIAITDSDFH